MEPMYNRRYHHGIVQDTVTTGIKTRISPYYGSINSFSEELNTGVSDSIGLALQLGIYRKECIAASNFFKCCPSRQRPIPWSFNTASTSFLSSWISNGTSRWRLPAQANLSPLTSITSSSTLASRACHGLSPPSQKGTTLQTISLCCNSPPKRKHSA